MARKGINDSAKKHIDRIRKSTDKRRAKGSKMLDGSRAASVSPIKTENQKLLSDISSLKNLQLKH